MNLPTTTHDGPTDLLLIDCAWCGDEVGKARQVGDDTVCEDCYTEGYVRDQV